MLESIIFQSLEEILGTAEVVVAFASAIVGFISGWFGSRKKHKPSR